MMRAFDVFVLHIFFLKQKTAYEMRISDCSSDVCSSDLWEPPEDRSDEFAVYISSGPAPDEPTVALLNFKAMDVDAFIDWGMSQVGEPWDCGGGWRDFVHTDPRRALMLLARAARRGSWPVAPWYAALGVRNDKGRGTGAGKHGGGCGGERVG